MANLDLNPTVSLSELQTAIMTIGTTNTYLILGRPGTGKTSLLKAFHDKFGKDHCIYLDAPNLDVGDISMRIPERDDKSLVQYFTDLIPWDGKPVVIMIDEIGKVPNIMKPTLTRLILERYIGDRSLPDGSIVFATSNNASDGVGDVFRAHDINRVTKVQLRAATNEEWAVWAANNGVHPLIRSWAIMNPRAFANYTDGGQEDNVLIFNPRRKQDSFVSLRSLTKCDPIVRNRKVLGDNTTLASLAGTIGLAAARSMMSFFEMASETLHLKDIVADPANAPLPQRPAAIYMTMFNALDAIKTQDEFTKVMQYLTRLDSREVMGVFYTQAIENNRTAKIANANPTASKWLQDNYKIMI